MAGLPDFIVVMGVAGTGKSAVGVALAAALSSSFVEADRFHSAQNVALMQAGIGLTDAQRLPWLEAVCSAALTASPRPVVIACSALKRGYRDLIRARLRGVRFVFLDGPAELIAARLAGRAGHFATGALLPSQLATLEPPDAEEGALTLAIAAPLVEIVAAALAGLRAGTAGITAA